MALTSPGTARGRQARRSGALFAITGLIAAVAVTAAVPAGAVAAAPSASSTAGRVFVIQGISGKNLDVLVDGKVVLAAAKPKTIVGPLTLAAGTHDIAVRDGSTDVADAAVEVKAGQSVDAIAHPATGASAPPAITAFGNDLASVGPGKVRLSVAHTAAAPPADIKVNGDVLFSNVANSEALTVVVPARTYSVAVVPSATSGDAILGPVDLPLKAGTLTRVFAIGDVTKGTMDAVVQSMPVAVKGAGAPSSVQTGDGGQAATQFTSSSAPGQGWVFSGALALLALLGAAALRGRVSARRTS